MSIQEKIEEAFKALVAEVPYSSIKVVDVCERAHVSRKAFYSRFDNKESIVEDLFYKDVIIPLVGMNDLLTKKHARDNQTIFYERMYQALFDEGTYYKNLVGLMRGVDDTFIRVATNAIYDLNMNLLPSINDSISNKYMDYIAYFFASSQAMLMQKWISEGFDLSVKEMASLYGRLTASFWLEHSSGNKVFT